MVRLRVAEVIQKSINIILLLFMQHFVVLPVHGLNSSIDVPHESAIFIMIAMSCHVRVMSHSPVSVHIMQLHVCYIQLLHTMLLNQCREKGKSHTTKASARVSNNVINGCLKSWHEVDSCVLHTVDVLTLMTCGRILPFNEQCYANHP